MFFHLAISWNHCTTWLNIFLQQDFQWPCRVSFCKYTFVLLVILLLLRYLAGFLLLLLLLPQCDHFLYFCCIHLFISEIGTWVAISLLETWDYINFFLNLYLCMEAFYFLLSPNMVSGDRLVNWAWLVSIIPWTKHFAKWSQMLNKTN